MGAPSPTSEGLTNRSPVGKQSMEMEEELHESDVMWPEAPAEDGGCEATAASEIEERELTWSWKTAEEEGWSRRWAASSSPPVGIPGGGRRIKKEGEDGEAEEEEWEPPHVVASRRYAAAGFSGEGRRRLKGRELRHVRDAVLRMTGFFEGELSRGWTCANLII
ncbi:protein S40-2-like [Curcuma longa]|uniref:protein S40-2-like n=1 Tax=Curcuma longa TaxID=136217 RepID=UPI003D9E1BD2